MDHGLASEDGCKGGEVSGGNFKHDPKRAAEADHDGGQNSKAALTNST
jgi:general stress protein YciG